MDSSVASDKFAFLHSLLDKELEGLKDMSTSISPL